MVRTRRSRAPVVTRAPRSVRPRRAHWVARACAPLGITPNAVTIASIVLGAYAGRLFYFRDLGLNLLGVLLWVIADTFDSADGQLARMTNHKSKLGRILDGRFRIDALLGQGGLGQVYRGTHLRLGRAVAIKVMHGGWFPLLIGAILFTLMTTWKKGRNTLGQAMEKLAMPLSEFFARIAHDKPYRVKGTAVFLTLTKNIAPSVLLHHYRHNQTLHERVILLSIVTEHEPEMRNIDPVRVTDLEQGFVKVVARYGYMETPDISEILRRCESAGLSVDYEHLSYFLGRETFVTTGETPMAYWRKRLFVIMSRNDRPATEFFKLPPDKVIEIGSQIRL